MKVWTIDKLAAHFKAEDPETAINATAIRRLVRSGAIPCAMVGNRYFVTLEAVEDYFSGSHQPQVERHAEPAGSIRALPERMR